MHFVRPIFILKYIYPEAIWREDKNKNNIYLTFDDGPIPEITPWILDCLKEKNVKATFFCVGENIKKHPEIFKRLLDEGHVVGNHTYNHLRGWNTENKDYFDNINRCQELTRTNLFRPPYGRAKKSQMKELAKDFKIVMWDVLTGDYDQEITPQQCYKNCIDKTRNGSIIVFHDNIKAINNVKYALPKSIDYLIEQGYQFKTLVP
ncbi:polysaccharide deacetylase family protein [Sphingobacterium sp. 1.A.5]|jgi:peptidoglycan/xylan/chitin deacetylase (PgdA/CDA1 family)|uniref:polysaccharide deacetylase family protein n=1 Tax=Sphingobacterium sp. 1.A.5 TaxID=2044604 RepID=UPI000C0C0401|nr:polysaccharide deacetylase family protein [Sphingobacterium sp. 1.A.5]